MFVLKKEVSKVKNYRHQKKGEFFKYSNYRSRVATRKEMKNMKWAG